MTSMPGRLGSPFVQNLSFFSQKEAYLIPSRDNTENVARLSKTLGLLYCRVATTRKLEYHDLVENRESC